MPPKRPRPVDAPVIAPSLSILPSRNQDVARHCSLQVEQARWAEGCRKRAERWKRSTPSFALSGVSLSTLRDRKKNTVKDREKAIRQMEAMGDWPSDCCSGRWYDKEGNLLVACFADHIASESAEVERLDGEYVTGPESAQGRRAGDVLVAHTAGKLIGFGLSEKLQNQVQAATQLLHSVLKPIAHKRDIRHDEEMVMEYGSKDKVPAPMDPAPTDVEMTDTSPVIPSDHSDNESDLTSISSEAEDNESNEEDGDENNHPFRALRAKYKTIGQMQQAMQDSSVKDAEPTCPGVKLEEHSSLLYEWSGVTHLVHAWYEQGRTGTKSPLIPSGDMHRTSHSALAVKYYFGATADVAIFLDAYFAVAFPEEHKRYKEAFAAGVWHQEDPGPWLGHAIVYKLQVKPHQDRKDGGPTAIFNVGQYTGGELYFTDLHLKFCYKPGHIFIFPAGDLYHAVGDWKPSGTTNEYGIVPGRIGHVLFSQKSALQKLSDKGPAWRNTTFSGLWPSTSQRKQVHKRKRLE